MQVDIYGKPRLSLSDRLTRNTATGMITAYQRYISPHKGFRCAHRVHHGGQSCSGYAKSMVQVHGLTQAMPMIRQRFRDCGTAAKVLRSQQNSFSQQKNRQERRGDNWASWCNCGDGGLLDVGDCGLLDVGDCGLLEDDGCIGDCDPGCDLGQGCDFGAEGCGEAVGDCGAEVAGEACSGCIPSIRLPRWMQLK